MEICLTLKHRPSSLDNILDEYIPVKRFTSWSPVSPQKAIVQPLTPTFPHPSFCLPILVQACAAHPGKRSHY